MHIRVAMCLKHCLFNHTSCKISIEKLWAHTTIFVACSLCLLAMILDTRSNGTRPISTDRYPFCSVRFVMVRS